MTKIKNAVKKRRNDIGQQFVLTAVLWTAGLFIPTQLNIAKGEWAGAYILASIMTWAVLNGLFLSRRIDAQYVENFLSEKPQ